MCLWANCSYLFLGLPSRNLPTSTPPQSEFPQTTTSQHAVLYTLQTRPASRPVSVLLRAQPVIRSGRFVITSFTSSHTRIGMWGKKIHTLSFTTSCPRRPRFCFDDEESSVGWWSGRASTTLYRIETVVLYCVYLPTDLTPHTGTPGFIVVPPPPPIPTTTESVAKYIINAQRGWFIRWCCWVSQVGCWPADPLSSVDRNKTVKSVKIVINRAKY